MYYIGSIPFAYDDIRHYGVLGMKWGVRKNPEYQYKSHGTKKYERKERKYRARGRDDKADIFARRAEKSRLIDRREQEYAKRVKAGGNFAVRLLSSGIIGGKGYQRALAMLGGTGDSRPLTLKKIGAAVTSWFAGDMGVAMLKAVYVRSGENSLAGRVGDNFGKEAKRLYNA